MCYLKPALAEDMDTQTQAQTQAQTQVPHQHINTHNLQADVGDKEKGQKNARD